ncbi:MAG: VanZ family protein [Nanoarchaeota archaeon]|nr:VanZ family protein [Nanoarchaeota archaeon]
MISWFERHNKLSGIITIFIAIVIFYISSLTFPPGAPGFGWETIAYHFYAFLFLEAFLLISITKGKKKDLIFLAIMIAIVYAVSDEIHQLFVPGRACSFSDILTDSAGILFATLIYSLKFLNIKNNVNEAYDESLYY